MTAVLCCNFKNNHDSEYEVHNMNNKQWKWEETRLMLNQAIIECINDGTLGLRPKNSVRNARRGSAWGLFTRSNPKERCERAQKTRSGLVIGVQWIASGVGFGAKTRGRPGCRSALCSNELADFSTTLWLFWVPFLFALFAATSPLPSACRSADCITSKNDAAVAYHDSDAGPRTSHHMATTMKHGPRIRGSCT